MKNFLSPPSLNYNNKLAPIQISPRNHNFTRFKSTQISNNDDGEEKLEEFLKHKQLIFHQRPYLQQQQQQKQQKTSQFNNQNKNYNNLKSEKISQLNQEAIQVEEIDNYYRRQFNNSNNKSNQRLIGAGETPIISISTPIPTPIYFTSSYSSKNLYNSKFENLITRQQVYSPNKSLRSSSSSSSGRQNEVSIMLVISDEQTESSDSNSSNEEIFLARRYTPKSHNISPTARVPILPAQVNATASVEINKVDAESANNFSIESNHRRRANKENLKKIQKISSSAHSSRHKLRKSLSKVIYLKDHLERFNYFRTICSVKNTDLIESSPTLAMKDSHTSELLPNDNSTHNSTSNDSNLLSKLNKPRKSGKLKEMRQATNLPTLDDSIYYPALLQVCFQSYFFLGLCGLGGQVGCKTFRFFFMSDHDQFT